MKYVVLTLESGINVRYGMVADTTANQTIYAQEVVRGFATLKETSPTASELLSRREDVLNSGLPYLATELNDRVAAYSYAMTCLLRPAHRKAIDDLVFMAIGIQNRSDHVALLQWVLDAGSSVSPNSKIRTGPGV